MFQSIQACRALAALFVVFHHLGGALASPKYYGASVLGNVFRSGDSGVEFFFVLSGFIITWVHAGDIGCPQRLAGYLRKRAVRIYPAYVIVFAIAYALARVYPPTRAAGPLDAITLVKSVLLLPQDAAVVGGTGAPVLIVAWSLQYEITFYAFVAILILSRSLGVLFLLVWAANLVAAHLTGLTFPRTFFADNLTLLFGLGMLVACCARAPWRFSRPLSVAAVAALGFISYAALETILGQDTFAADRRLVYGGLSAVVILGLVQAEGSGALRIQNRWVPLLGDASYALYLIHFPLISLLCKVTRALGLRDTWGALIAFPLILLACVFAAIGFHRLVERPILRALSSSSGRREPQGQRYASAS